MRYNLFSRTSDEATAVFKKNDKLHDPSLYEPSEELINAVRVALTLGQPLLLTGEPGTGKTELAFHLSHELSATLPDIFAPLPDVFTAQTSSSATDMFYRYDALRHFQFSRNTQHAGNEDDAAQFITFNALGKAILRGNGELFENGIPQPKRRSVVLIDEIDKAPRDLPNDVLYAVERMTFRIPELNNKVYGLQDEAFRPVLILTSNSEKNLPDAFLRRVTYFNIEFPSSEKLMKILESKVGGLSNAELDGIVNHFDAIRKLNFKKSPATAELIAWAVLLQKMNFPIKNLTRDIGKGLSDTEAKQLLMSYSVLAKIGDDFKILKDKLKR